MEDVAVIKFGGKGDNGFGLVQAGGYAGKDNRVAAAVNDMFAPEIAVLGMSSQISAAFQTSFNADLGIQSGGIQQQTQIGGRQ